MTQQTRPEGSHDIGFAKMMSNLTDNLVIGPDDFGVIGASELTRVAFGETDDADNSEKSSHNGDMEYVPRPELDAKLQTMEAKMDGRIARIEDAVNRISDDNAATRAGITNLKTTLIVTAVGVVLTIVLGIAAFNATLTSNMLSAFQAGQQTATQANK
jgi:hypothetical protein